MTIYPASPRELFQEAVSAQNRSETLASEVEAAAEEAAAANAQHSVARQLAEQLSERQLARVQESATLSRKEAEDARAEMARVQGQLARLQQVGICIHQGCQSSARS